MAMMKFDRLWKEDWATARRHHIQWWNHEGLVLWLTAPKDRAWEDVEAPQQPKDLETRTYDPVYKYRWNEHNLSRTYCGGDAFPLAGMWTGAGDLAAYLGCEVGLSDSTVWFHPCITDPLTHPDLVFNPQSPVFVKTMAMIEYAVAHSRGRFFVSQPDLVENIDILSAMRGPENLMLDLIEQPQWVERSVRQINQVYFTAFDALNAKIKDADGGNTCVFGLWGPGRTCKVQCDACAMFGPQMFRRFVTPSLTEQCRWLDYALYHLDGTQAVVNLDELLAIEPLRAIEWTPQSGLPGGGDPHWYDLYRRVRRGGKSVQAIGVRYEEVIPLLDAVGPKGLYIETSAKNEDLARALEEKVNAYR
jgi:hypothetical protein